MAAVYILYSDFLKKFYIGSCDEINVRLDKHLTKIFPKSFTAKVDDWVLYFVLDNLSYAQARKIEVHIKQMKSKKYIENLKRYPELPKKLIEKYLS